MKLFRSRNLDSNNSGTISKEPIHITGKSLSEALIFSSTNPQYDNRLLIELQVQYIYENSKLKPGENMFCTEIVSNIRTIFVHNMFSPMFCKKEELLTKIYL